MPTLDHCFTQQDLNTTAKEMTKSMVLLIEDKKAD